MKNNGHKFWSLASMFAFCVVAVQPMMLQGKDMKEKIKEGVENVADHLKKGVDEVAGDIDAVQKYFNHYTWKGVINDETTIGVATVGHLHLNGHSRAVAVHPGEKIEGSVRCFLDPEKCSALSLYRVVIGLKGVGPQTTVCNYLGTVAGKSKETFTLTAPQEPGLYEIRFRPVESMTETGAFEAWKDENGQEPDRTTTIGVIYVK